MSWKSYWSLQFCQLNWIGLGGLLGVVGAIALTTPAFAQIRVRADNTLGSENSQVVPLGTVGDLIQGGAVRGGNLFHSFESFSIPADRAVYFANPANSIQNILARVTGGMPSEILGILGIVNAPGVTSAPNLFLINPNGIVLGPTASLDVAGSFAATTANSVQFGNQGFFSATDPTAPPLLTVNPSAFLFNSVSGSIVNQSRPDLGGRLSVPDGQSLLLAGGNILFDGGQAFARGGRLELSSVSGNGRINLNVNGSVLQSSLPQNQVRGDVQIVNGGLAYVSAPRGGDLVIQARNVQISGNSSSLVSGSIPGVEPVQERSGDIRIDATGHVTLNAGFIVNFGTQNSAGDSGDILVNARSLNLLNASQISSGTSGTGNGGGITLTLDRALSLSGNSGITTAVALANSPRISGDITIRASSLNLQDAFISATNLGEGDGGSLFIQASHQIRMRNSTLLSSVGIDRPDGSTGSSGDITVQARSLDMQQSNLVSSSVGPASGTTGDIQVVTGDSMRMSRGVISSFSSGQGDGGNISVRSPLVLLQKGASIETGTQGTGNAGNLSVRADRVELSGVNLLGSTIGGLTTQTLSSGRAGNLTLNARQLSVRGGAHLSASTNSTGRGGNVTVNARESVDLVGTLGPARSSIETQANRTGNAGNLSLRTGRLTIRNGALVSSATLDGTGNAGNVTIHAADVRVQGVSTDRQFRSGITSETQAQGNAGNVVINTDRFTASAGAGVSASASGTSSAQGGSLTINATDSIVLSGMTPDGDPTILNTTTQTSGAAGNLTLNTRRLQLSDGASINSGLFGQASGQGGTLNINATDSVELSGLGAASEDVTFIFTGTSLQTSGNGGDLNIRTGNLRLRNGAVISAQSLGTGSAGDINIQVGEMLEAEDGEISTSVLQSSGGAIRVNAQAIRLRRDSDIRTDVALGGGNGGNIVLTTGSAVALDDSDILAFARDGRGGNITLDTPAFFGENYQPAPFGTNPDTLDNNDRVDINASGRVSGVITLPDVTYIQNSLSELPENLVNVDSLIANTCIARGRSEGSFVITGAGGLPVHPGEALGMPYPTGEVRGVDATQGEGEGNHPWQKGDPIHEPQGVYRLPDGRLVLGQDTCSGS